MKGYRLQIKRLDFISAVDAGAQGPISNVALIKRAPTGDQYTLTATVAKLDESLGVVFGYAVASTVDGGQSPHIDLQGDAVVGGDELIKVALGFAEAGAQSDVMHDCIKDGWVPFVMPLNAETKKAFKLAGDVEGIAIGMKPSQETFKRFQSGELAAFSIYGEGVRTPLPEQKRAPVDKIQKSSLYTDEVEGHQHAIRVYEDGTMWVDSATMAGAEYSHSHGIVFEGGVLTILADSGHKHVLAEGQTGIAVVPADAIVVVQARATHSKSTRSKSADEAVTTPEKSQMPTEQDKTIAELTKRAERAERLAKFTDAHKAHLATLSGEDADAFVAKSHAERDAVVAEVEKANEVVYTSKSTGETFRKSDDPRLVAMAKRQDAQSEEIAKRDDAIEKAEIAKLAKDTIGAIAGDDDTHAYIVKSIRKGGGDAATVEKALTSLRGANDAMKSRGTAPGANPGSDPAPAQPLAKFNEKLAEFAKGKGKTPVQATAEFVSTPDGAALYDELLAAQN